METRQEVADLSRVLAADEIGRVRNQGWSGVLALSQGEVSKGLYFLDGAIVFAASTVEEDRLGACLFRAGPHLRAAVPRGDARGRGVGLPARLRAGRVARADARTSSRARSPPRSSGSCSRCCAGRAARCGASRWTGRCPPTRRSTSTPTGCCCSACASFPDAERLERALGDPDRRLRRVSPPPFDYEQVERLARGARGARALLARRRRSPQLLALPHPRPQLVRAVHALLSGGLIEDAPGSPRLRRRGGAEPAP